jgi:UDP-galactopyranose mutase
MPENWKTVILGAGPAGLAAAIAHGDGALVLEKAATAGGLSSSREVDGAVFDRGGHSFHSPHPEVRSLVFQSLEMFEQTRVARCYSHGSIINYPFQQYFHELRDQSVVNDCRRGLESASAIIDVATFDQYLPAKFGAGIAEHFLLPYNQKLWGTPLSRMSSDWVTERVASASHNAETSNQSGGKRRPLYAQSRVAYPAKGGFGEISVALAQRVPHLRLKSNVISVDTTAKELKTEDGSTIKWQQLISTLPIDQLIKMSTDVPAAIQQGINSLERLPLALIMVVVDHPVDTDIQRIYSADSRCPAHKIVLNHNSSDYLRSKPRHGIMGEVSMINAKPSTAELERSFVESLLALKLIRSIDEIKSVSTTYLEYGYPVPTLNRVDTIATTKDWLLRSGIHTLGRFGEWAYINADEAIFRGLRLGKNLAGNTVDMNQYSR